MFASSQGYVLGYTIYHTQYYCTVLHRVSLGYLPVDSLGLWKRPRRAYCTVGWIFFLSAHCANALSHGIAAY